MCVCYRPNIAVTSYTTTTTTTTTTTNPTIVNRQRVHKPVVDCHTLQNRWGNDSWHKKINSLEIISERFIKMNSLEKISEGFIPRHRFPVVLSLREWKFVGGGDWKLSSSTFGLSYIDGLSLFSARLYFFFQEENTDFVEFPIFRSVFLLMNVSPFQ